MEALDRTPTAARRPRVLALVVVGGALALFLSVGLLGLYRYLDSFWLYRGFPPPHDPAFVTQAGSFETIQVTSRALGGRSQPVDVYLPPGYAQDTSHGATRCSTSCTGSPATPTRSSNDPRWASSRTRCCAKHALRPMILVMPFGSTGIFTDKEWVNGIRPDRAGRRSSPATSSRAVDARYRTIPSGSARGLAGLSEGGYGALNIGIHHPREFHLLESWSGYEQADDVRSIFGGRAPLLARNSPLLTLPSVAARLRAAHTYVWFYTGSKDGLLKQNERFAHELGRLRVPHRFFVVSGGHNWALWRGNAWQRDSIASAHLAHG